MLCEGKGRRKRRMKNDREIAPRNEKERQRGWERREQKSDRSKKEGKRETRRGKRTSAGATWSIPLASVQLRLRTLIRSWCISIPHWYHGLIRVRLTYCLIIGPPIQHEKPRDPEFPLLTISEKKGYRMRCVWIDSLPRHLDLFSSFLINTVL